MENWGKTWFSIFYYIPLNLIEKKPQFSEFYLFTCENRIILNFPFLIYFNSI
ncbi:MAG: hypothetical protein K0R65_77 [Crocinitomicaceae bacterium]|jgi:hypothetical protein|nr:hypothetical protein [Crocinitomicaceae bacterium]